MTVAFRDVGTEPARRPRASAFETSTPAAVGRRHHQVDVKCKANGLYATRRG
jgi:hypothetical protein